MILEDFVMLGTTVPEPNSDGRVFVCSAGVSPELRRLVRIYPLARRGVPRRWNVYRVPVELNPRDSRPESFKISGDRDPGAHERINAQFQPVATTKDTERAGLLRRYAVGSVREANERRMSLAVVHPDAIDLRFEHNPQSPDSPQQALFDVPGQAPATGAKRFPWIPRLRFHDELGWHELMLRDWGSYEFQRKNSADYFRQNLAGALHLRPSSSLLIGNMNNQRTSWLVISVLNGLREAPSLFDALPSDRPRLTEKQRRQVYDRDGWKCVRCGEIDSLTIDHIWPYSRGGSNALENLQTLCGTCNTSKADSVETAA